MFDGRGVVVWGLEFRDYCSPRVGEFVRKVAVRGLRPPQTPSRVWY